MDDDFVPVIELEPLFGTAEARRDVARRIGAACERSGFLVMTNHRVPDRAIEQMYSVTRQFFRLPTEEKTKVSGFRPPGESALARTIGQDSPPDLVETFGMRAIGGVDSNQWPAQPATFEATWKAYYATLDDLAMRLMRAFALALDLPEDWFDDKFDQQTKYTTMIANYYPPQVQPPLPGQLRRGAHTDYGSLTILLQDDSPGGLQVQDTDGGWRDVPHLPGSFIVNIGDLMAHWTNDRWVSTMHRVVNPPREFASRDRISLPFFQQPDAEAVIECIPSCQSPENPAKYPPVTSGEWRDMKMARAAGM